MSMQIGAFVVASSRMRIQIIEKKGPTKLQGITKEKTTYHNGSEKIRSTRNHVTTT